MSPRRVGILVQKEVVHGSKNFLFFFAILVPIVISLVLSLAFGTLFSGKPRLGITDEGSSQMVTLAREPGSITIKDYPATAALQEAVRMGVVDMGIVLPQDFDRAVTQGEATAIAAFVWGESLARHRMVLAVAIANVIIEMAGHEVPVEIVSTTLGDAESLPWKDRLLPFIILMTVFMGGTMIPATSLVEEKQKRTLKALTVTPATLEEVFLTKGLVGVMISLLMGVVTLALNQAFGSNPPLLVLALGLGSVMAAGIGILLGTLVKDITSLFAAIKSLGLFLYAPALVYLFPQIPQWIGKVFPTYYVIQPVVEITQRGGTWSDIAPELLVLVGLIAVLFGAVAVTARRVQQRET